MFQESYVDLFGNFRSDSETGAREEEPFFPEVDLFGNFRSDSETKIRVDQLSPAYPSAGDLQAPIMEGTYVEGAGASHMQRTHSPLQAQAFAQSDLLSTVMGLRNALREHPVQHISEAKPLQRPRREIQAQARDASDGQHRQKRNIGAENAPRRIHTDREGRTTSVERVLSLSDLSHSLSEQQQSPEGLFDIFRHIPQPPLDLSSRTVLQETLECIDMRSYKLQFMTYNIRGLKRFGRQCELSYLLDTHQVDFLGAQETKCTGNTLNTLAAGYLINSSDTPAPGKEEHRGTGILFRKRFATALRATYQGSSRWCGALFSASPVPILVLSVNAPTAAATPDEKQLFYREIGEILSENGGALVILLGDFNARILRDPGLPRHIGQNIFESRTPLGDYAEDVLENRDLFVDFLLQQDLVALNALVETLRETQVTYRNPGQPNFEPPWEDMRYAQIDYILTKNHFRNLFASVCTRRELDYDSDHLPISTKLIAKWVFGSPKKEPPTCKHSRKCTPEAKRQYNTELGKTVFQWDNIQQMITDTAKETRGISQPDIKNHTCNPAQYIF